MRTEEEVIQEATRLLTYFDATLPVSTSDAALQSQGAFDALLWALGKTSMSVADKLMENPENRLVVDPVKRQRV